MISDIKIRTVFCTSRKESIEAAVKIKGRWWTASVPFGTSKGVHEVRAAPMREIEKNISEIKAAIKGKVWPEIDDVFERLGISRIGGNLALALSIAAARARFGGELWKIEGEKRTGTFPHPLINVIGGGAHGGKTDWQEFLILPKTGELVDDIRLGIEIWHVIGDELKRRGLLLGQNIEGAWMAKLDDIKTLDFLSEIADDWGVRLGIDCASSRLWDGNKYAYKAMWKLLSPDRHLDFIADMIRRYKIFYIEDPCVTFSEFKALKKACKSALIVGDDIFCTNPSLVRRGVKEKAANGIIIKPNQVGTLTSAMKAVSIARSAEWEIIPSHRSHETEDFWIADLAVAWRAKIAKFGMNDMPKFNRLLALWSQFKKPTMANL
ncbi:MAG: hypothetical protein QXP39_02670 [Candidatus Aenigmatarchaeota archaeon]